MAERPVQVLMVDDDQADIDLTVECLAGSGFSVGFEAVHDGQECLAYLRRQGAYQDRTRPDLILLDLNMPGMGGLETLEAIRADPELQRIPVVILSTSDAEEDIVACYERTANCFVTKPVGLDQFSRVVEAIEAFWVDVVKLPGRS